MKSKEFFDDFLKASGIILAEYGLMEELTKKKIPFEKDWDEGKTTWIFDDGSYIVVQGPYVYIHDAWHRELEAWKPTLVKVERESLATGSPMDLIGVTVGRRV